VRRTPAGVGAGCAVRAALCKPRLACRAGDAAGAENRHAMAEAPRLPPMHGTAYSGALPSHERGTGREMFQAPPKLGLSSFGGPVAHLGYLSAEFVERRLWLGERDYAEPMALRQFLPAGLGAWAASTAACVRQRVQRQQRGALERAKQRRCEVARSAEDLGRAARGQRIVHSFMRAGIK